MTRPNISSPAPGALEFIDLAAVAYSYWTDNPTPFDELDDSEQARWLRAITVVVDIVAPRECHIGSPQAQAIAQRAEDARRADVASDASSARRIAENRLEEY